MNDLIRRRTRSSAVVAGLLLLVAACSPGTVPPSMGTFGISSAEDVVHAVLASGAPAAAPAHQLALARYSIQPGARLGAHRHPGMQIAFMEGGTLNYRVIQGAVTVHQLDGGTREIAAGRTGTVTPGEWFIEDETTVMSGENDGPTMAVILVSSLLVANELPAIPVTPAPPS